MDTKWIGSAQLFLIALGGTHHVLAAEEVTSGGENVAEERCAGNNQWAYVAGMGLVNDDRLQAHVDEMRNELENASASLPRSRQQRKSMERHLVKMQQAMGEMQGTVTDDACGAAATAAPVDQRVQALEKRLDGMQQMLEQLVARQQVLGDEE